MYTTKTSTSAMQTGRPAVTPAVNSASLLSTPARPRSHKSSVVQCSCFTTGLRCSKHNETQARRSLVATQAVATAEGPRGGWAVMEEKAKLKRWTHVVGPIGDDQVDIKVMCNGLCHTDMSMRDQEWGISKFPFIPGHEVVGVVSGLGKAVKGLEIGQRVGVGWIADSCRKCPSCMRGNENVCLQGYKGLIVMGNHGGFQDVLRAPADFTYPIPDGLDSLSAAPLLCAGVTVFAPLRRHIKHPGSSVAILGVGGLGHLAVQFAKVMGAQVTAIDVDASKADEAVKSLGANKFVTFADATGTGPNACVNTFDVILNTASGKIDTGKLLDMLQPDGTLIQVGIPGGAVMSVPLQSLVFGQKSVVGSIVGGRADMMEMLLTAANSGVRPMLETFPLSKVNEAMDHVGAGKARYRVVLLSEDYQPETDPNQRIVNRHT